MIGNSKKIITAQDSIHKDLIKKAKLYTVKPSRKEIPEQVKSKIYSQLEQLLPQLEDKYDSIIFDLGCGTGESTKNIATNNPKTLVIGTDKSHYRMAKAKNLLFDGCNFRFLTVKSEYLLILLAIVCKSDTFFKFKISKVFILYPNPYPKSKHLQRRWQASPYLPFIFKLPWAEDGVSIELRTNWSIYAQEFNEVMKEVYSQEFNLKSELVKFSINDPIESGKDEVRSHISNFERKYSASNHELFKVLVKKQL